MSGTACADCGCSPVIAPLRRTRCDASLGLDVLVLDDLSPHRGLAANLLCELLGRAGLRVRAEAAQALGQVALRQRARHLGAQLVDDLLRRSARRAESVPRVDVEA